MGAGADGNGTEPWDKWGTAEILQGGRTVGTDPDTGSGGDAGFRSIEGRRGSKEGRRGSTDGRRGSKDGRGLTSDGREAKFEDEVRERSKEGRGWRLGGGVVFGGGGGTGGCCDSGDGLSLRTDEGALGRPTAGWPAASPKGFGRGAPGKGGGIGPGRPALVEVLTLSSKGGVALRTGVDTRSGADRAGRRIFGTCGWPRLGRVEASGGICEGPGLVGKGTLFVFCVPELIIFGGKRWNGSCPEEPVQKYGLLMVVCQRKSSWEEYLTWLHGFEIVVVIERWQILEAWMVSEYEEDQEEVGEGIRGWEGRL
ncbi:hypothetical protein BU15DRAFT_58501 [Melanogaster broomeanus]|nr:hypothetical protein BU15DRAFT_58501 [Melanogaster broomeanus]